MNATYAHLKERLNEIWDLSKIGWLLGWDQSTMMPKGGSASRAEHSATIARLSHQLFASDEIGRLLSQLESYEASLPRESDEASLIRVARSDWEKIRRVPSELAAELARASAAGYQAWIKARAGNDFASFLPYLESMIELKRRYVACFPDVADPYDALLDDFERG
ncbi:MAG: carboxypeptidase M32, partial [Thermomicrobiales bacterium]|nr:carboxypeptidase M32 [Thermomicrobiales bacterium]